MIAIEPNSISKNNQAFIFDACATVRTIDLPTCIQKLEAIDLSSLHDDVASLVGQLVEMIKKYSNETNSIQLASGLNKALYFNRHPSELFEAVSTDLPAQDNFFFYNIFPYIRDLNSLFFVCIYLNMLPNYEGVANNSINLPTIGDNLSVKFITSAKKIVHSVGEYQDMLEKIRTVKKQMFSNLESAVLISSEIDTLRSMSFFPGVTLSYLARDAAVNVLNRYECGILLEMKYAEMIGKKKSSTLSS